MRKNWLWYELFRSVIVKWGLQFFYKNIVVRGKEKVPQNKPILYIPNHQNSFMDALLVVTNVRSFIYFLTRAEAFRPKLMAAFLRSLNMLPVYRVRDGFSSVSKNNDIFEECVGYLKRNDAVLVFAEANHDLKRRVRPLSKGFTRIAFGAEEAVNWQMDLQVVPVGLNYGAHRYSGSQVEIVYGDPIPMSQFRDAYKEDEREAARQLKEKVSAGMEELVMHVPDKDQYPLHHVVLDSLEYDQSALTNPAKVNRNVSLIEENATPELIATAAEVYEAEQKLDISAKSVLGRRHPWWAIVIFSPFYLFSLINNLIPYLPVHYITTKKIKDHAFDASIKLLMGVSVFPLFWILVTTGILISGAGWEFAVIYLMGSVFSSLLFRDLLTVYRGMKEDRALSAFKVSDPDGYDRFVKGIKKLNDFRAILR